MRHQNSIDWQGWLETGDEDAVVLPHLAAPARPPAHPVLPAPRVVAV